MSRTLVTLTPAGLLPGDVLDDGRTVASVEIFGLPCVVATILTVQAGSPWYAGIAAELRVARERFDNPTPR